MKTQAAVTYGVNKPEAFIVKEIELDDPKDDEVLVHLVASGMCHSDWHFVVGEQTVEYWPMVLGHEGAGVVEKVGKNVDHVKPGDHVVLSYIPTCGKCYYCLQGLSQLCNEGAVILNGPQPDGTFRMHDDDGTGIGQACLVSTFSEWTVVPKMSVVKVFDHYPLEKACLVACGVIAGAGAAMYIAPVKPGSSVAVWGVGGVGMNTIQGAKIAGAREIIAVDIHDWKLEKAKEFGATHVVNATNQDAVEYINEVTWGKGADYTFEVISTQETIGDAIRATGKVGTAVIIGLGHHEDLQVPMSATDIVLYQRTIKGSMYGGAVPHNEIPNFLRMYDDGLINLDGLVTKEYPLEAINEAYQDQLDGKLIRGVIRYPWDYR